MARLSFLSGWQSIILFLSSNFRLRSIVLDLSCHRLQSMCALIEIQSYMDYIMYICIVHMPMMYLLLKSYAQSMCCLYVYHECDKVMMDLIPRGNFELLASPQ